MKFHAEQALGEAKIACLYKAKLSMQVLKKNWEGENSLSKIFEAIRGVTKVIQRQKGMIKSVQSERIHWDKRG